MTVVGTVAAVADVSARPAEASFTDAGLPDAGPYCYRVACAIQAGPTIRASPPLVAKALDDRRPAPPAWQPAVVDAAGAAQLSWTSPAADLSCLLQRRPVGAESWDDVTGWLPRGQYSYQDAARRSGQTYTYRLRVRDVTGRMNNAFATQDA
jgi:hypothetical protein